MADSKWIRLHSGNLLKCPSKTSRVRKKWRQRYYILYSNGSSVQLQHFDSAAKAMKTGRTTSTVNNDTVELVAALYSHPKHDNVILVQLKDGKEIYLAASSSSDMNTWHSVLSDNFNQRMICLKVQWRYQNDAMEWCSYTEEASAKIEDMRQRGVASFSLDKQLCNCNKAYLIYLEDMMQASPRSGTKRLIERVTTKLPARKQTATSDMATPLSTSPRLATSLPASSSQAVARKTSLTVPSVSPARRSRSTSPLSEQDVEEGGSGSEDDTSLDGDCDLHTWVYASDEGDWLQYDTDQVGLLDREYLAQVPVCVLGSNKATWFKRTRKKSKANQTFVTFGAMQEINPVTGKRREVRRVLPNQIAQLKPPAEVTTVSDLIGLATMRNAGTSNPEWVLNESDAVKALYESVSALELAPDCINIRDVIGQGAFGRVSLATLTTEEYPDGLDVAVKTLQGDTKKTSANAAANNDQKLSQEILKEASTMAKFLHPNIVRLLGVCCQVMPSMLVMEYMNRGDLLHYLRRPSTHLQIQQQLSIILQVAQAMVYLVEEQQFVHRDVAARNVLVHEDDDGTLTAKVTDFGLSRDLYSSAGYRMSVGVDKLTEVRLPAKWMALESLEFFIFNSASDVWSFGVMIWEVMTHGHVPYAGVEAPLMYLKLRQGLKLEKPTLCPDEVYKVILNCCKHSPKERPAFRQLRDELTILLCDPTLKVAYPQTTKAKQEEDWGDDDYRSPVEATPSSALMGKPNRPPRPEKPPVDPSLAPPRPLKPSKSSPSGALSTPSTADSDQHRQQPLTKSASTLPSVPVDVPAAGQNQSHPPVPRRDASKQTVQEWMQKSLHLKSRPHDTASQTHSLPKNSFPAEEHVQGSNTEDKKLPDTNDKIALVPSSIPSRTIAKPSATEKSSGNPPSDGGSTVDAVHVAGKGDRPKSTPTSSSPVPSSQAESTAGMSTTQEESVGQNARLDSLPARAEPPNRGTRKKSEGILMRMKMFETSEKPPLPKTKPAFKTAVASKPSSVPYSNVVLGSKNHSPSLTTVTNANPTPTTIDKHPADSAREVDGKETPDPKHSPLLPVKSNGGRRSTLPGVENARLAARRATLASAKQSSLSDLPAEMLPESGPTVVDSDPPQEKPVPNGGENAEAKTSSVPLDNHQAAQNIPRYQVPEEQLTIPKSNDDDETDGDNRSEIYMDMEKVKLPQQVHDYVNLPKKTQSTTKPLVEQTESSQIAESDYEVMTQGPLSMPRSGTELIDEAEYTEAVDLVVGRGTPDMCFTPPVPGTSRPLLSKQNTDDGEYEVMLKRSTSNTPDSASNGPIVDEGYALIADLISARSTPEDQETASDQKAEAMTGTLATPLETGQRRSYSTLTGLSRIRDEKEIDNFPLSILRTLASEEGVTYNHWQKEDVLRSRLRDKWIAEYKDHLPPVNSSPKKQQQHPLPEAPVRPPAPLPAEAMSPLDVIVAGQNQTTGDGDEGAGQTSKSLVAPSSTSDVTKADAGPTTASQTTPAKSGQKPLVPPRPAGKPTPPPRPKLKVHGVKSAPPDEVDKENKPSPPQQLYEVDDADDSMTTPRPLSKVTSKGYIDAQSISSSPSRNICISTSSESSTTKDRPSLRNQASYLSLSNEESDGAHLESNDIAVQLENEVFLNASVTELQGVLRCAENHSSEPLIQNRLQLMARIRHHVRKEDSTPGLVSIAGGLLAATRLVLQTATPHTTTKLREDTLAEELDDLQRMHDEGYSLASELVFRGPGKAAAERFAAGVEDSPEKSPDSVFSRRSLVDEPDKTLPAPPSRSKPNSRRPSPSLPKFGKQTSDTSLPPTPSKQLGSPNTPTAEKTRKGRLASAYTNHILPALPAAKGKLATLFRRRPQDDGKVEKPTTGRKVRSKSITDISFLKVNKSNPNPVVGSATVARPVTVRSGPKPQVPLNKRGSIDDTFLENMKANVKYGRSTSTENAYLLPCDESGAIYADPSYGSAGQAAGGLRRNSASNSDDALDTEYMEMSSVPVQGDLDIDEEYQDMAAFAGVHHHQLAKARKSLPVSVHLSSRPPLHEPGMVADNSLLHAGSNARSISSSALDGSRLPVVSQALSVSYHGSSALKSEVGDGDNDLVVPRCFEESLASTAAYSVKPLSRVMDHPEDGVAYQVTDALSPGEDEEFELAAVKTPDDIAKLSTYKIRAFLRANSVKYRDNATRPELIEEAKELWADDAYFPVADIIVPRLQNLPSEAAVYALSLLQKQMVLEANGHDGAEDCSDEQVLTEYVLKLWRDQLNPSDPNTGRALSTLRSSDIMGLDDDDAAALAVNHRLTISPGEEAQDVKEKVWNLWAKKQSAVTGSARPAVSNNHTAVR